LTSKHDVAFRSCRETARLAADAIADLYDHPNTRFWRDTAHRAGSSGVDNSERRFPTVSLCCTQALLMLEMAQPNWRTVSAKEVTSSASSFVPGALTFASLFESSLSEDDSEPPTFTLTQLLQTLGSAVRCGADPEHLRSVYSEAEAHPSVPFRPAAKGPRAHPFVLYHVARALEDCVTLLPDLKASIGAHLTATYSAIERLSVPLLADYRARRSGPADVVAMAFCGAGLAQDSSGSNDRYAAAALVAAAQGQETSGCWALGRLVREDRYKRRPESLEIEISTYEISGVMAEALTALRFRSNVGIEATQVETILGALLRSVDFASNSLVRLRSAPPGPLAGWCSDHPFNDPVIESWTSAAALRSSLAIDALLRSIDSEESLAGFAVSYPWDASWPDWLRWAEFRESGETDHEAGILTYIDSQIIAPILASRAKLPSARDGTVSALLFGPPGTSKTTIVKAVADGLGWPLLELNPGVFIEQGLELIEARAGSVFNSLLGMERVVVLFDECDELFRARGPMMNSEQMRSITAFVTASMLPKLQKLHDEGRVVFFICTNNFDSLDSAVKRRGRVDHIIAVGPPDEVSRRRIVESQCAKPDTESRLWQGTERFSRGELLHLVKEYQRTTGAPGFAATGISKDDLVIRMIRDYEPSLNISAEIFRSFSEQKRTVSNPNLRKANGT
jgi:hypothetical protein